MSYPGAPGVNTPHPSLPSRPPPSNAAFARAAAPPSHLPPPPAAAVPPPGYPATSTYSSAPSYSSAPTYGASAAPIRYGASQPPVSYGAFAQAQPVTAGAHGGFGARSNNYNNQQSWGAGTQQSTYGGAHGVSAQTGAPQIRNPFPSQAERAAAGGDYDPEMAAQIASWQSAYLPRDPNAEPPTGRDGKAGAYGAGVVAAAPVQADAGANADLNERKKTVYRTGGGKKWADDTLTEWDPAHQRLFVGNLAGETTDESLLKAFSGWKSVVKAKVIRDKRTTKSKGYGFVSFSDSDDFFQAAKEMNGKYIQSHPVTVRKATTEIKVTNVKDDRKKGKHNNKNKNKNQAGNGSGAGGKAEGAYEPHLGPIGGGIYKPGQKTKGGLKLLG